MNLSRHLVKVVAGLIIALGVSARAQDSAAPQPVSFGGVAQPVSQSGSVTVTPGTGTWQTNPGLTTVTPGTGTWNPGLVTVTPGTGTFSVNVISSGSLSNPWYGVGMASASNSPPSYVSGTMNPLSQNTSGYLRVEAAPVDGLKATYFASAYNVASAATPTDLFCIYGSASKTTRVVKMFFGGAQTTGGQEPFLLVRRSSKDTGGTVFGAKMVYADSFSPAATSSVTYYTANPSLGVFVGTMTAISIQVPNLIAAYQNSSTSPSWDMFNINATPMQAIVLRGTGDGVCINAAGNTMSGGSFAYTVYWTEE